MKFYKKKNSDLTKDQKTSQKVMKYTNTLIQSNK